MANSIGTVVGSKSLTLKRAVILAGIFEFCGAVFVGSHVTNTVRKGIIDIAFFVDAPELLAYGMFSVLLASALIQNVATCFGMPISTTHCIVGSVFGFGLISAGADSVYWGKIAGITATWVFSPVFGGFMGFGIFVLIRKLVLSKDHPYDEVIKIFPYLVFALFSTLVLAVLYKGLKNLHLDLSFHHALFYAILIGTLASVIARYIIRKIKNRQVPPAFLQDEYIMTENVFGYLQLFTCAYIAFAHGANDVANAIGPLAAVCSIIKTGTVEMNVAVPMWVLMLGGTGIVVGLATYGYKVTETIGKKITEITPSRGFSAEFGAATTVLICSKMGIPISTTHTIVGAVIGVGYARGISTIDISIIRNIFASWILTIPIAAATTVVVFKIITLLL